MRCRSTGASLGSMKKTSSLMNPLPDDRLLTWSGVRGELHHNDVESLSILRAPGTSSLSEG